MEFRSLSDSYAAAPQITALDVREIAASGFRSIISNRPDGEAPGQPSYADIVKEAAAHGLTAHHIPFVSGKLTPEDVAAFREAIASSPGPVFAFCRSGKRAEEIWKAAGGDGNSATTPAIPGGLPRSTARHDIVIVGGGAAGISVAASLLARRADLDIAIIEPAETHYYQPGWTMVGAGIFTQAETARPMASVMPRVTWIKAAVSAIEPRKSAVTTIDGNRVAYGTLIMSPGLRLDWQAIAGLSETLGQNGVTSNYRFDLAPYTWQLVQSLKKGRAIFTQPPMPIKCAGAPQKALYLSADYWLRHSRLQDIDVAFCNAGGVLFGVADYVPALMDYMKRYNVALDFGQNLIAVDGRAKKAVFKRSGADGSSEEIETDFDLLHVCPSQTAHEFARNSELADASGWIDVDPATLRHKTFENVYGLGDATNTPNAKTAAAARKQAPVVAENLLHALGKGGSTVVYDGYGSCPLTVEKGKIVLAEFAYGGKVCASFPKWLLDGTRPSRAAWILKKSILPRLYWDAMLKGREWMAKPEAAA